MKDEALPKGWRRMRLNTVASVKTGPFGAQLHQHDYVQSNGTPIVTVEHLNERGLIHKNLPLVSYDDKQRLSQYIIREGDIVFSRVGSVDRSALVSKDEDGWLFSGRLLRVRPKRYDVYSSYLNYFFHTQKFRHHMKSIAVGGTMPSINTDILSNVIICLPSMDEQKAIASLLETWDTAIEKTEALIAAKEKQFKWLLKTLISDQQDNPEWRKMKLGEFGTFYKGKGITKADLVENGIPCLRYAEIYTKYDGIVNELISSVSPDTATKATPIQSGDIIFAASGETAAEIGKAIAFVGHYPAVAGGDTVIFRDHGQEPAYLAHALNDVDAARQKARLGKGQSVVHIHVPELFQVEVSLPPLHEQRKIVKILTTWDTAIEKTKALAEQYRTQKRGLMQKLLTGKWKIQI